MSGICGIVHFDGAPVEAEFLRSMTEASAYRGPDGIDYWIDGQVGLGHLALHTTPESVREKQPYHGGESSVSVVAAARIDDRQELAGELRASGHLIERQPTDVELIAAAYGRWGEDCPDHLLGDFAFAVWDARRRKLLCARDAVGAKPFHYSFDGCTFRFASDLRQVLADPAVSKELDGYAISDFLTCCFRRQARTMFGAVQKLLPGHCLVLDERGVRAWRYWNPDRTPAIRYRSEDEYVEHFRELLHRATADRLRTVGGGVGLMVSGGLDSSSVAVIAQKMFDAGQSAARPVAYTVVSDRFTEVDEREYSLELAGEPGIELHQLLAEDFALFVDRERDRPRLETPAMLQESLTHHVLSHSADRGCDVLLNGFGGDSLFHGGMQVYRDHMRRGRWHRLPPWIADARRRGLPWPRVLRAYLLAPLLPRRLRYLIDEWTGGSRYWHVPRWVHPELIDKTSAAARLYAPVFPRKFAEISRQKQYEGLVGLAQQGPAIELWETRAAEMRIDARYPLLDRRLAEFALAVPIELSARPGAGNTKWLLRQAMAGLLPERIRQRQGKGTWRPYLGDLLYNKHRESLVGLFTESRLADHRLVHGDLLLQDFLSRSRGDGGHRYGNHAFFIPLCMEMWLRVHTRRKQQIGFRELKSWQSE